MDSYDGKDNEQPGIVSSSPIEEIGGIAIDEETVPSNDDIYGPPPRKPKMPQTPPRSRKKRWPMLLLCGCMCGPFLCCVMTICIIAAAGASLAAVFSNNSVTDEDTRTFSVPDDAIFTLDINNRVGKIEISAGSSDEVSVTYTRKAWGFSDRNAREALDDIEVNFNQPQDDVLEIKVNLGRAEDDFFFKGNEVDMEITVPRDLYLTIDHNIGDVRIEGVNARTLDITNNIGDIHFEGTLTRNTNAVYDLQNNLGGIYLTLPEDTYLYVDAETDVGDISIDSAFQRSIEQEDSDGAGSRWEGTLGSDSEPAPTITLKANVGDIKVEAD